MHDIDAKFMLTAVLSALSGSTDLQGGSFYSLEVKQTTSKQTNIIEFSVKMSK